MGKIKYRSLKREYIINLIYIIGLTALFYVLTLYLWYNVLLENMYPANYQEQLIPGILEEIDGNRFADAEYEKVLNEKLIPLSLSYQALDSDGNFLYGNEREVEVKSSGDFYNILNRTLQVHDSEYAYTSPILNGDGEIAGGLLIRYSLGFNKLNGQIASGVNLLIFLSPIVYLIVFTFIFARRYNKKLQDPIEVLTVASNKIKDKDLDFSIQSQAQNELGDLINSFEDMRSELSDSLGKQWKYEQDMRENTMRISHDLKTPLTIVKTNSEFLLNGELDEKFREHIETIDRNTKRAISLLNNMNVMIKLEDGEYSFNGEVISVEEKYREKLIELDLLTESAGILLKSKVVFCDEGRGNYDWAVVEEVLDNIISNAIRYTDVGGTILVEVEIGNGEFKTSISNSGSSFKDIKRVFEKYYKGDSSRSFNSGESGLGLYISKVLVEGHGGKIRADNDELGANITFTIKEI